MTRLTPEREAEIRWAIDHEMAHKLTFQLGQELLAEIDAQRAERDVACEAARQWRLANDTEEVTSRELRERVEKLRGALNNTAEMGLARGCGMTECYLGYDFCTWHQHFDDAKKTLADDVAAGKGGEE